MTSRITAPETDATNIAPPPSLRGRLDALDVARGLALVAMASYHLAWDLSFFELISADVAGDPGWRAYARAIAASFLLLVGVGLVLGHGGGLRRRPFLIRLAKIVAAAALISAATYVAFPDTFIYFGILHHIALASVVGLAFLRLPAMVTLAAAALALVLPSLVVLPAETGALGWWTGLTEWVKPANDFVPLFPWISAVLAGIGVTRIAIRAGLVARIGRWRASAMPVRLLASAGRHSLAVYLIHQPLLYGLVWLAATLLPADPAVERARFIDACEASCRDMSGEAALCTAHCGCIGDRIAAEGLFGTRRNAMSSGDPEDIRRVESASAACAAELTGD
ncbi:DUF1624 domain-containing protein [Methylobrevis pamukkalensis]|uniref:Heparan-alpha-glucosaminide N-acetyltransferase catalytic domain-containing protein n=1 Tax=Methylobrevis pamukkalensis TaxID=1439726 RepID=A0A1E3H3G0_9HYPH|nr:heparan-alpha-glucosaminide N-acetyltransferase [Methylobrevis pamukkalensis]ODN70863.1 hypothetical protein A6302_01780 [Methylobrevis pamukkalensis]